MKKLLICILIAYPFAGNSQQDLLKRFKDKAKSRAEQRIDQGMDKAIDKVEEEARKKRDDNAGAKDGSSEKATANSEPLTNSSTLFKVYSKYDFSPGDRIVYAEDYLQDEIGELPLQWTTNNRGETVNLGGASGKWMQLFAGSRFASPSLQKLPQNFTLEMDVLLQYKGEGGYVYPEFELKLLELVSGDSKAQSFLVNQDAGNEVAIVLKPSKEDPEAYVKSFTKGRQYFTNDPKKIKSSSEIIGKPFHLSVWVQKERLRYWINGEKVFDIPIAVPADAVFDRLGFSLESSLYTPEQFGVYVTNIKIAEGTSDLRSKLISEGKMVTNGILFDVNSDRIRPESVTVLKSIAQVLKDNSSVKVKIVGHTDSDGDEKNNLELSKRRAVSVMKALSSVFEIEADRLQTDGQGETKPVAENKTSEGRAKNRRVEFIKL